MLRSRLRVPCTRLRARSSHNTGLGRPGGREWFRPAAERGSSGGWRLPGTDLEAEDAGLGLDATGFGEPLVDGGGDVTARGVDPAGEIGCVEPAGPGGAVGAFFGVVGAWDYIPADPW